MNAIKIKSNNLEPQHLEGADTSENEQISNNKKIFGFCKNIFSFLSTSDFSQKDWERLETRRTPGEIRRDHFKRGGF